MNIDNCICLIPARGGSQGLKNKNILDFNGIPLIAKTIQYALKFRFIDDIVVSTDCKKIKKISEKYGASVPFLRPNYLAKNTSKSINTYTYVLNKLSKDFNKKYKTLIVLLPTSPLRKLRHLNESYKLFHNKKAFSVISLTESQKPLEWLKKINKNKIVKNVFDNKTNLNRQSYSKKYFPNGSIYIFNVEQFKKYKIYYTNKSYGYVMEKRYSIDIDDKLDFEIAKLIDKNISL